MQSGRRSSAFRRQYFHGFHGEYSETLIPTTETKRSHIPEKSPSSFLFIHFVHKIASDYYT